MKKQSFASEEKKSKTSDVYQKNKKQQQSKMSRKLIVFIAIVVVISSLFISFFIFKKRFSSSSDSIIVQDIKKLQHIFLEIDKDCKIVNFEHVKNYIDFLTVQQFVGSQVGSMSLLHPSRWRGPYVTQTPTVDEQQYLVLKNKNGYYVIPGDGVVLANGKTIGKDIFLNEKTDIEALLRDPNGLRSKAGDLAIKVLIGEKEFLKALTQRHLPLDDF
ncbi:hypothetical protein HYV11_00195 [Candidatus Dependentiae bacterium]|nr:hypothetical protein [Candidatus Dependentiae bacterium]